MVEKTLSLSMCSLALLVATFTACSGGSEINHPAPAPTVASIVFTAPDSVVRATHTLAVTAKALDAAGNDVGYRTFIWSSGDTSIATVEENGFVRGKSMGYTTIFAQVRGVVGRYNVRVLRAPLMSIALSITPAELVVGKSVKMTTVSYDSTGKPAPNVLFFWNSSDGNIARVDPNGVVTPISAGTVRIDANIENIFASITIKINPLPPIHFKSVSTHDVHSCGLSVEGAAYCWGTDKLSTLGSIGSPPVKDACRSSGGLVCTNTPLTVQGGHTFSELSSGYGGHTCALASDGAYCWGAGPAGEIGNGARSVGMSPTKVTSSSTYTSLSVGNNVTCGLTTTHAVDCWGSNDDGELGDSTVTETCPQFFSNGVPVVCSSVPRRVSSALTFDKVSVGYYHVCALTQDGIAYCWGSSRAGGLGAPTTSQCAGFGCNKTPVKVATDLRFTDIGVGLGFTCGLTSVGQVYCWGVNQVGQLGIGKFTSGEETSPVPVSQFVPFRKLFVGYSHACAIDAESAAYCWGGGTWGQIGDGGSGDREFPKRVLAPGFASLRLGTFHTCGIDLSDVVFCWGRNTERQLGQGHDRPFDGLPAWVANQQH